MKLNKEQIIKIRELRKQELGLKEIAIKFKVSIPTILYHADESYRQKTINGVKRNWAKKSKSQRSEVYKTRNEYMKNYMKHRYNTDEKFREKAKERLKRYSENKNNNKKRNL